jgi:hypothetical protein
MHRIGAGHLEDLFALREADCRSRDLTDELERVAELRRRAAAELASFATLKVTDLAVDGGDVMRVLGVEAGPVVGEVLERLLGYVLEDPSLNTREALFERLKRDRG